MTSKVSFFFATESLSILHPETKNYKFFKRSKKKKNFFSSHIICWFTVLQKKWKILRLKNSLLHQQLKSMFFWNFFVTTYVPSDLDNTTVRIWLFFQKNIFALFLKFWLTAWRQSVQLGKISVPEYPKTLFAELVQSLSVIPRWILNLVPLTVS